MTNTLQIRIESAKSLAVMSLEGRIDIDSSPGFRDRLLPLLQGHPTAVAIDLGAVAYMDAAGVATLVEALKIARLTGIAMCLQGVQGRVLHLLQSTGISSLFDTNAAAQDLSATRAL